MSAITAERPPQVAPRGPGRVLQPPVGVAIRLVLAWHVVAALVFAWIAWNIVGAVWQLESLPRTAIGAGAAVGIAANVLAAVLIARSSRRARMTSFTVNYLTLILVIVLLFQSLDLAAFLDDFAASFNAAFLPFIGMALAVAWIVLARRLDARLTDANRADVPPALTGSIAVMRWIGLGALALFALLWLWQLEPWTLASLLAEAYSPSALLNTLYVAAIVILLWCTVTMWAQRTAIHYDTPADKLESQAGWLFLSPNLIGFLLFFAGPLIFSLVISFYAWDGITSPTFVGLGNYIETLGLSVASTADDSPPATRTSSPRPSA